MNFDELKSAAHAALSQQAWDYYQGVAGGEREADRDYQAWQRIDVVPRMMQGLRAVDLTLQLSGRTLQTPVMVSATAAHGLAHPEAEMATATAAAAAGALMVYSSSAATEVTRFGASATGAWWAQIYLMINRSLSNDYVDRCVSAGAEALVLTVDLLGELSDAPFRRTTQAKMTALPANFPGLSWPQMSAGIDPHLQPGNISELAERSGLPVHVKGILHPADALAAVEAGAAGIIVSNHGRRQLAGVVPTALVLQEICEAVGGRVPVMVDGGIRSGVDVLRALALGATAVGLGRPVLWGLAAAGAAGVTQVLDGISAELAQAMVSTGAGSLAAINAGMVRPPLR